MYLYTTAGIDVEGIPVSDFTLLIVNLWTCYYSITVDTYLGALRSRLPIQAPDISRCATSAGCRRVQQRSTNEQR